MEPEVKIFFAKIVKSLSMGLLWMLLNMTFGIFFDFGFVHTSLSLGNVIFYIFLAGSFAALVWYLLRVWKDTLQA